MWVLSIQNSMRLKMHKNYEQKIEKKENKNTIVNLNGLEINKIYKDC